MRPDFGDPFARYDTAAQQYEAARAQAQSQNQENARSAAGRSAAPTPAAVSHPHGAGPEISPTIPTSASMPSSSSNLAASDAVSTNAQIVDDKGSSMDTGA
jgi:hypothetical protein